MSSTSYRTTLMVPGVARVLVLGTCGRLSFGIVPFSVTVSFATTHGFGVAGLASAVYMLAIAMLGPARGRMVDSHGPRFLAMFAAMCIPLLCTIAFILPRAPWLLTIPLAALAGATTPPLSGAVRTN